MSFRRVVTGRGGSGADVVVSDGTPPNTVVDGGGVSFTELLWLDGPARTADAGPDRSGDFRLEPPVGGLAVRIVTLAPPSAGAPDRARWWKVEGDSPERPGMHATDTLDLVTVLAGELVLGLDDGEHRLASGDTVVQRGNPHRWQVAGARPCTFAVTMVRPDPLAPELVRMEVPRATAAGSGGWRRLVAGTGSDGRSRVVVDGPAPAVYEPAGPGGVSIVELWQTGGFPRSPADGGDPPGSWEIEPRGGGIAYRGIAMPPGFGDDGSGWHTTATIDVDIVISGRVELTLPGVEPVVLGPGDAVVQRATEHRWAVVGDEPVRYVVVMAALRRD